MDRYVSRVSGASFLRARRNSRQKVSRCSFNRQLTTDDDQDISAISRSRCGTRDVAVADDSQSSGTDGHLPGIARFAQLSVRRDARKTASGCPVDCQLVIDRNGDAAALSGSERVAHDCTSARDRQSSRGHDYLAGVPGTPCNGLSCDPGQKVCRCSVDRQLTADTDGDSTAISRSKCAGRDLAVADDSQSSGTDGYLSGIARFARLGVRRDARKTASGCPVDCQLIIDRNGDGAALSGPKVEVEISPPLMIASDPALTRTSPAFPVPNPAVELMKPPSMDKVPGTFTLMLPAAALPVPRNASTEMSPSLRRRKLPALTVISPAFPVPAVLAVMPVRKIDDVPSIDSAPPTVTAISPPLPAPTVSAAITPSALIANVPAETAILPAPPVPPVSAMMPVGMFLTIRRSTARRPQSRRRCRPCQLRTSRLQSRRWD